MHPLPVIISTSTLTEQTLVLLQYVFSFPLNSEIVPSHHSSSLFQVPKQQVLGGIALDLSMNKVSWVKLAAVFDALVLKKYIYYFFKVIAPYTFYFPWEKISLIDSGGEEAAPETLFLKRGQNILATNAAIFGW